MRHSTHVTVDNCVVTWQEILGLPSANKKLVDFIDEKLAGLKGEIAEETKANLDGLLAELLAQIKEELGDLSATIDPYKVVWRDTTVGDALDKLFAMELSGTISEPEVAELGEKLLNHKISWKFNKPIKSQKLIRTASGRSVEVIELEPEVTEYEIEVVTNTEEYRIDAVSEDGEKATLETGVTFKLRWYRGVLPETDPSNKAIINLASEFVDKDTVFGGHLFNCSHGAYIYYAFPNDLHLTYNFVTNGLSDSGFVWETKEVYNSYGYMHTYRIFRSINLLHGDDIFSEVYSNDSY